jgi:probable HAF family extracellular repeat protein
MNFIQVNPSFILYTLAGLVALVLPYPAPSKAETPVAQIADLGQYGHNVVEPLGLNNAGRVLANRYNEPAIWKDGRWTRVVGFGSQARHHVMGFDDQGRVAVAVPTYSEGDAVSIKFYLWGDGRKRLLPMPDEIVQAQAFRVISTAVSDRGLVVGLLAKSLQHTADSKVVLWENGQPQVLNGFPNDAFYIKGINDRKQILGSKTIQGTEGFLWENGHFRSVSMPPFNNFYMTSAESLNNAGEVVGATWFMPNAHAFRWSDGEFTDLGALPDFISSGANDINDSSQIVGMSIKGDKDEPGLPTVRAVMWRDDKIVDLNTLLPNDSGWVLTDALRVNNKGQILGVGQFKGKPHVYLLTLKD